MGFARNRSWKEKNPGLVAALASLFLVGEHVGSQQLVLAWLRGIGMMELEGKHACICICVWTDESVLLAAVHPNSVPKPRPKNGDRTLRDEIGLSFRIATLSFSCIAQWHSYLSLLHLSSPIFRPINPRPFPPAITRTPPADSRRRISIRR